MQNDLQVHDVWEGAGQQALNLGSGLLQKQCTGCVSLLEQSKGTYFRGLAGWWLGELITSERAFPLR